MLTNHSSCCMYGITKYVEVQMKLVYSHVSRSVELYFVLNAQNHKWQP